MSTKESLILLASGALVTEYLPETRWQFNAITDQRTCDDCMFLDGVIFTTNQIARKFPYATFNPLLIYPNVHPHCRCALALLEERPLIQATLPPEVVVSRPRQKPEVHIQTPLTQDEIDKVRKAISFASPYGEPEPFGPPEVPIAPDYSQGDLWFLPWAERYKRKERKKHK